MSTHRIGYTISWLPGITSSTRMNRIRAVHGDSPKRRPSPAHTRRGPALAWPDQALTTKVLGHRPLSLLGALPSTLRVLGQRRPPASSCRLPRYRDTSAITTQELAANCSLVIRLPGGTLSGQFVAVQGPQTDRADRWDR
jgi:hypothetical protein